VDRLAELLGYLPLALEQAAAYIGAPGTSCTYREYIGRSQTNRKHFLSLQQSRGSTGYPWSVYATWRTTIDCLPVGSRAILRMAAFMASTPIPQALWEKSASMVEAQAREIGPLPDDRPPLEIQIPEWIAALARYSMVQPHGSVEDPSFSVHGLVQAVEADSIAKDEVPSWIEKTRDSLIAYAPDETAENPKTWPVWDMLRPHAEALVSLAKDDERAKPQLALLISLGQLYFGKGLYPKCLLVDEMALDLASRTHGPENASFASRLLALGETLRVMGRYSEAEAAFRKSLAISEMLDGPRSLSVASDLNYVAIAVEDQGRESEAEELLRRALAIYESEPDADKVDFAKVLNNLGMLLSHRRSLDEAERMCRKALSLNEEMLGNEHPLTLAALNNVARVLEYKGNYAAAEPLHRHALEVRERVLGPEHPHTRFSVGNLASLLSRTNRPDDAEPLFRRALAIAVKAYGPDHESVATDLNNLASFLENSNRIDEAEALYRRALAIDEKAFGPDHPYAAIALNNLARLLQCRCR
jgi:tetratricopeptide (TPR) repeat protein